MSPGVRLDFIAGCKSALIVFFFANDIAPTPVFRPIVLATWKVPAEIADDVLHLSLQPCIL